MTTAVSGILLAGGRSRRFGEQDKALAAVDGRPMIVRVAERVAPVVDELIVNCRRDQREGIGDALDDVAADPRFAVDPVPDRGPVYGLRTGLRTAAGQDAVVVACDMPFIEPALLEYLLDRASETDSGVVPRVDSHRQPLCGVYDVAAGREACEAAVARSEPSLRTVLECLDPRVVPEATVREHASPGSLRNVNTPADLDTASISN